MEETDDKKNTPPLAPELVVADEPFPFFGLLCYADALDWLLMVSGTIGSFVHGMAPFCHNVPVLQKLHVGCTQVRDK